MRQDPSLRYTVVLHPEPEGGFTVTVPVLPGCITYGKDLNQAKEMAADAITAYIASLEKHGEPLPEEDGNFITSVSLKRSSVRRTKVYA
jgi:predicted RNase H-like HicB family nuclease